MTHSSEDELLAYALEVVANEEQRADTAAHLQICPECRGRLEGIRADIDAIAGVRACGSTALEPEGSQSAIRELVRGQRRFPVYTLLRAAALIVVGVVVGFGAGSRIHREPVFISPAYTEGSVQAAPAESSAVSDATGIPAAYYEEMAKRR